LGRANGHTEQDTGLGVLVSKVRFCPANLTHPNIMYRISSKTRRMKTMFGNRSIRMRLRIESPTMHPVNQMKALQRKEGRLLLNVLFVLCSVNFKGYRPNLFVYQSSRFAGISSHYSSRDQYLLLPASVFLQRPLGSPIRNNSQFYPFNRNGLQHQESEIC
jgi:hypothetical protein